VELAPLPQWIPTLRRLDLYHLRAEFGEELPGERAGDQLAELEHLDPFERPARAHAGRRS
jgi:hypothetical protein